MRYTVTNAPWPILWATNVYGGLVTILWFALVVPWRLTLRVRHINKPYSTQGLIYCFWHEGLGTYFLTHLRIKEKQVWLQHPLLFMRPIHFILHLMGVSDRIYGSTGHGGKDALAQVAALICTGHSTVITPDGPAGPVKQLKPGVILLARATNCPIVPVTFHLSRSFRLSTWDRKPLPWPFSTVRMQYHQSILVAGLSDAEVEQQLVKAMGG